MAREIHGKKRLGLADSECIAVAHNRKNLLVTNDGDIKAEADRLSVHYVDLPGILRMLWKGKIMSKDQIKNLIEEIERRDRITIQDRDIIFR